MKALLITLDKYPDLDAGALRIHMFGKMLYEEGYEVIVISMGPSTRYREITESDGIKHISYRGTSQNILLKAFYYLSFSSRLYLHLKRNDYNVIIHSQVDEWSLAIIQTYGRKKNIPVIYDSVEWFSESQFSNGRKARAYRRNERYNTSLIKEPSSVIAISKYLESHFKNKGLKTIRIPVVMDTSVIDIKKECDNKRLTLLYAGSPGKKDYLANVVNAIDLLDVVDQKKIKFVILGCTSAQLVEMCGVSQEVFDRVKGSLEVKGRVPRGQVLLEYAKADFSVLIRPTEQRYAMAGFPTKFVESLCCSTPVLCNITSDLNEYAIDGKNSVVLNNISPDVIAERLKEMVTIDFWEKEEMKLNARNTAVNFFDYHYYIKVLTNFIDGQK